MVDREYAFGKEKYSMLDNVIFSRRRRQVVQRLPKTAARIADFGSGYDCRLLRSLQRDFDATELIAVDTEFDSSLSSTSQLSLVTADLNKPLPLPDASIDVGLSLAVLEHLDQPDIFLSELYRVMRPGGVVLLTTPGPSSQWLLEFLAFRLHVIDEHEIRDHKHYFSSSELRQVFETAGFLPVNIDATTFIFGMNNIVQAIR
jgi:SAM-dependent methyltransferase